MNFDTLKRLCEDFDGDEYEKNYPPDPPWYDPGPTDEELLAKEEPGCTISHYDVPSMGYGPDESGTLFKDKNGKFHREHGPAVIHNGASTTEEWWIHGIKKKEMVFDCDGYSCTIWFDKNGKPHKDDGPASIHKHDGKIYKEIWYKHGMIHRDDGPAYKDSSYGRTRNVYYYKGFMVESDEDCELYRKIKNKEIMADLGDDFEL